MARQIGKPRGPQRDPPQTNIFTQPMSPPENLTAVEASHWCKIVRELRGDWFQPENAALLVQLCRHLANADRLARELRGLSPKKEFTRYTKLAKTMQTETRLIAILMQKMRLTQQSRYNYLSANQYRNPVTRAKVLTGADGKPRPWNEGQIMATPPRNDKNNGHES